TRSAEPSDCRRLRSSMPLRVKPESRSAYSAASPCWLREFSVSGIGCARRGGGACASAATSAGGSGGAEPWRAGGVTTPSVATRSSVKLVRSSEAGGTEDVVCASHVRGGPQPANSAIEIARITLRLTGRASERRPLGATSGEVYTARAIWEPRRLVVRRSGVQL